MHEPCYVFFGAFSVYRGRISHALEKEYGFVVLGARLQANVSLAKS